MTGTHELRRLEQALHSLDVDKREIFLAHCVHDQNFAVIATRKRLTTGQVEQLFAEAMFELIVSLDP